MGLELENVQKISVFVFISRPDNRILDNRDTDNRGYTVIYIYGAIEGAEAPPFYAGNEC